MRQGILIVDDEGDYNEAIRDAFSDKPYTFFESSTVDGALDTLMEHSDIQVILLDLKLGERSGSEVLERLQVIDASKYRVIILTAHDEYLAAEMADKYGVFSYQAKAATSYQHLIFAVERAFKDIEFDRYKRRAEMDFEIMNLISSNKPLVETLDVVCSYAREYLGAYTCHIRLFDLKKGDFVLAACQGPFENTRDIFKERRSISEFYSGYIAKEKRPFHFPKLQQHEPFLKLKEELLTNPLIGVEVREYLNCVRSAFVAPIFTKIFGSDVDAVLNVSSTYENFFSLKERRQSIKSFATYASAAIARDWQKVRREEVHKDYHGLCQMLVEITEQVKDKESLNGIYSVVTEKVSKILHPEIVSIFRLNEQTRLLENISEQRAGHQKKNAENTHGGVRSREEYQPSSGLTGRVFAEGRTIRFSASQASESGGTDLKESLITGYDEEQKQLIDIPSHKLEHYLGVPIQVGHDVIGVIRVVNKRSQYYGKATDGGQLELLQRGFSDDCETELEIAASHLAVAIRNAELLGQLKTINSMGRKISSVDVDELLEQIVKMTAEFMSADICLLFHKNETGDKLAFSKSYGMPEDSIRGASYGMGEGKTGKVAETGDSLLEERADREHDGKYDREILAALRDRYNDPAKDIESFMAVPIFGKEQSVLAVIKVINKVGEKSQFNKEDLRLLEIFASQIGLVRFAESQRYRAIISNSPVPIIVLDEKGNVKMFGRACEVLWKYKSEHVIGKSVIDLYGSIEQARTIGMLLWRAAEHRIENYESSVTDSQGAKIPISLSATFLLNEEGQKIGSVGVFKDLRELKQLQDQLVEKEKLETISLMAKTVVHDIRNDLSAAFNYVNKLILNAKDEELRNAYTDMREALVNISAELEDVRLAGEPRDPQMSEVVLEDILSLMTGSMTRRAIEHKIDLIVRAPQQSCEMRVDMDLMRRVMWNLYYNSNDAIAKKGGGDGRIEVLCHVLEDKVEFTWEDNGCGIADEVKPNIFSYFLQPRRPGVVLG